VTVPVSQKYPHCTDAGENKVTHLEYRIPKGGEGRMRRRGKGSMMVGEAKSFILQLRGKGIFSKDKGKQEQM